MNPNISTQDIINNIHAQEAVLHDVRAAATLRVRADQLVAANLRTLALRAHHGDLVARTFLRVRAIEAQA